MQVQRNNVYQASAAGSLLAALAKSDSSDASLFRQTFSDSLEAVAPRREADTSKQKPIDTEAKRAAKTPRRDDRAAETTDTGAEVAERAAETSAPAAGEARQADRDTSAKAEADAPAVDKSETKASTSQEQTSAKSEEPQAEVATKSGVEQATASEGVDAGEQAKAAAATSAAVVMNVDEVAPNATTGAEQAKAPKGPQTDAEAGVHRDASQKTEAAVEEQVAAAKTSVKTTDAAATSAQAGEASAAQVQKTAPRVTQARQTPAEAAVTKSEDGSSEADSTNAGPRVISRNDSRQTQYHQALRSLDLQGQAMRATVFTVQVVPSAGSGEQAEAATSDPSARVAETTAAPRVVAARVGQAQEGQSTPTADQAEQIDRIVRVMRASISRGGSRVSLDLEPAAMGRLRVQMQIRGSDLTARFETQNETSRAWLHSNLGALRESLASQGLRLVSATVESRPDGGQQDLGGQNAGAGTFTAGGQTPEEGSPHRESPPSASQSATEPSAEALWTASGSGGATNRLNVVI